MARIRAGAVLEQVGYASSYLVQTIGYLDPMWQPQIGPSFQCIEAVKQARERRRQQARIDSNPQRAPQLCSNWHHRAPEVTDRQTGG
jgi:hypothetical protein